MRSTNTIKTSKLTSRSAARQLKNRVSNGLRSMPAKVWLSCLFLILILFTALFPQALTTVDPNTPFFSDRLTPPALTLKYPLGTDDLGRDLLSRVIYGGRASLLIGLLATLFGLIVGTGLGVMAGYLGGIVDHIVTYLVDVQLSLPFLLLAIAISLVFGNSLNILIVIAGLATWPAYARVCRGVVLSLRERDYITAAEGLGASRLRIALKHLLPGLVAPVMVLATISMGRVILVESGLSFLGIGIKPPTPSWGNMIDQGRSLLGVAWWVSTIPGIALTMLTMSLGTLGDWLRDVFDPALSA